MLNTFLSIVAIAFIVSVFRLRVWYRIPAFSKQMNDLAAISSWLVVAYYFYVWLLGTATLSVTYFVAFTLWRHFNGQ